MNYAREFRAHWRPLLASSVGMALGLSLNHYVMSLFAPELLKEFDWTRAQFALVGAMSFISIFLIPVAGRLTDRFGPRVAAAVGFTAVPLGYLAFSMMNGSFGLFLGIVLFQSALGTLTTTMVFSRVIVERYDKARGFALSLVISCAPMGGAIAVPFIGDIIADHGWRSAYEVLALVTAVGGILTLVLMGEARNDAAKVRPATHKLSRQEIAKLFATPLFPLAIGGMLLVNIPQLLVSSQLVLVLADNGATGKVATGIVALYAAGVAVGRVLCGLALDRIAVQYVAIITLGLPAIGLAAMASSYDATWILSGAILLMALAQGAESDIGAYLISRKFALRNYSLIASFMTVALTLGSALGSVMLSYLLSATGSYVSFMILCAVATLIGAFLFYLTGRYPAQENAE
ncbi:MFS transporter [Sphingorhabdus sp.]|uniref:MFS transporter n=1 Tax=Sphingorhabdus sp. TaxID=1902408 RepID=UPI004048BE88